MKSLINLNYQNFSFNPILSKNRLEKAESVFGKKILINILCLCLYLLGLKRVAIATTLGLPENTVRAKLRTFVKDGFYSLGDRRQKNLDQSTIKKQKEDRLGSLSGIKQSDEEIVIAVGETTIVLSRQNPLQTKAVLLALVDNHLIKKAEAAQLLDISPSHIGYLCNELKDKDIYCLIDGRKGSQKDYKFSPDVKAELIQEFAVSCLIGRKTSGKAIGEKLDARFNTSFSERGVRFHMQRLGLNRIKKTLPEKYNAEKKTV